jgi:hypothetical protein
MSTRRKKKIKTSPAHNIEVYNHVNDEIKFINPNKITIFKNKTTWYILALIFIVITYIIL